MSVQSLRQLLGTGAGTLLCCSVLASLAAAQENADTDTDDDEPARGRQVEEIVVTGSRIRRTGVESPTPTTIIDSETIRASGVAEIADLINEIPSLFVTQSNQTSNLQGNAGLNALDLRGLGTDRTLVLVNGRRRVPAMPGTSAVDVSTIPPNLVERVEVITGGASALYGADAVAGVTNFILKKDYEGVDSSFRYGASTRGDLDSYDFDFLYGTNFAEDRGNVTLFAAYGNQPGTISGEDRPWTARGYPLYVTGDDGIVVRDGNRSIYDHDEAVVELGARGQLYTFDASGNARPLQLGPGGILNLDVANATLSSYLTDGGELGGRYDDWLLRVPYERAALHNTLDYALDSGVNLFLELTLSRNESKSAGPPHRSFGNDTVPLDSPFITDEIVDLNSGPLSGPLPFTRKYFELGQASTEYERELIQTVSGLEGSLPDVFGSEWTWSAYYSFGQTRQKIFSRNGTASNRYFLALDSTTDAMGNPVCRSTLANPDNGCVPLNPFRQLTPDVIDYLQYDAGPAVYVMKQHVVSGHATGDLFALPAGPVQAVVGAEYREESNDIGATPEYDPESPRFDPSIGITETSLVGEYDVREAFAELRIPILAEKPFFEQLSVESAIRYSNYSTAGDTTAYKYAAEWAPIQDIRFRTTYGQAVRAPNIGELFTTTRVGGQWITDPCNDFNIANRVTQTEHTAANCALVNPSDTFTYWLWRDILHTGNPDLDVETAKTFTAGLALQPRFLPKLAFTVDYFDIDLGGAIDAFGAQLILEKCVDAATLDNFFCDYVNRDADGNIETVEVRQLNLSAFRTEGVDFEIDYSVELSSLGLGDNGGTFSVNAVYTHLLSRDFILDPNDPNTISETVGLFGSPEWKGAVRSTYTNGPLSLYWTMRHFSSMRPDSTVTPETHDPAYTGEVRYHDFFGSFYVTDNLVIYGGLRNAFDREPPRLPGAEAGGANFEFGYQSGVYDVIGRTYNVGFRFLMQ